MNVIKQIIIFLTLVYATSSFAQRTAGLQGINTITVSLDSETTYTKSLEYLHNNDFFILTLNKSSGFIQAKKFIKTEKIFSNKQGERLTLNFLITPLNQEESKITLVIYKETGYSEILSGKEIKTSSFSYYEDNGISTDASFYEQVLSELEENIQAEIEKEE